MRFAWAHIPHMTINTSLSQDYNHPGNHIQPNYNPEQALTFQTQILLGCYSPLDIWQASDSWSQALGPKTAQVMVPLPKKT